MSKYSQSAIDRFSWLLSSIVHGVFFIVVSINWVEELRHETEPLVREPVQLVFVQKPVSQPSTKNKPPVSKKSLVEPVSREPMPGDRPSPEVVSRQPPVYPKLALNNNFEGRVSVRVSISRKGTVQHVKILSSSGHDVLDSSFIRTIKQYYIFKPKREMGKNIADTIDLAYEFKIGG